MGQVTILRGKMRKIPVNHGSGLDSGHTSKVEQCRRIAGLTNWK